MGIAFVNKNTQTSGTTTLTFVDPSSASGQALIVGLCIDFNTTVTWTPPDGTWTQLANSFLSAVDGAAFSIWYKASSAGVGGNLAFTADNGGSHVGFMNAYSGIGGVDIAGTWNLQDTAVATPWPETGLSITTTHNGSLVLWAGVADAAGSMAAIGAADEILTTSGPTGNATGTSTDVAGNYVAPSGYTLRASAELLNGEPTAARAGILVAFYASGPAISVQPQNQSVAAGQTATFTVTASGTGTLHYQWKDDGSNVGTDSSSYTTSALSMSDNGSIITCVVTDDNGSTTSTNAILRVQIVPSFVWLRG